jgi:hypothetical protein
MASRPNRSNQYKKGKTMTLYEVSGKTDKPGDAHVHIGGSAWKPVLKYRLRKPARRVQVIYGDSTATLSDNTTITFVTLASPGVIA